MPMDRFLLRKGSAPPEAGSLLPFELGYCESEGALYIGQESGAKRLTFPEPASPPFFSFTEPSSPDEVPVCSLFADADGHLCYKNNLGETLILV